MLHTDDCFEWRENLRKKHDEYVEKWPDFCRTCSATGVVEWVENGAPHGEGYWPMPMADICGDCQDKGLCPRCGKQMFSPDDPDLVVGPDTQCSHCGWTGTDAKPAPPDPDIIDCGCWAFPADDPRLVSSYDSRKVRE